MIFEVDSAILEATEFRLHLTELAAFLWGTEIGRHRWHILDPERFKSSEWFTTYLSTPQKSDFEKFVTSSAHGNPRKAKNYFKIGADTDARVATFNFSDAKKLLTSPLFVVVEGAGSDGTFVKALIRCFGDKSIQRALQNNWLVFDNSGGTDGLPSAIGRIEARLSRAVAIKRTFCLFDSDSEHAQDDWRSKGNAKPKMDLERNGYAIHGLFKRMIENYLPDGALKEIVNQQGDDAAKARLKLVLAFSPDQRDFFHLKKGFNYRSIVEGYPENLFPNIFIKKNSPEYRILFDGFRGLNLNAGFGPEFKVDSNSLRARCSHTPAHKDELENIVKTLTEML